VREIRLLVSDDAIVSFSEMGVEHVVRQVLLVAYADADVRPDSIRLEEVDEVHQTVKLSYWFSGALPEEQFSVDTVPIRPTYETVQHFDFYGRTLLKRRIIWVPRGRLTTVSVDGRLLPVVTYELSAGSKTLTARQLDPLIRRQRRGFLDAFSNLEQSIPSRARELSGAWLRRSRAKLGAQARFDRNLAWSARSKKNRDRFADAWVFMDRNTDANDNAEHLYRHVSANHPEINSWFVLDKQSSDWARLEAEGFRLVAYQSHDWHVLLLHAKHLASAHIDQYVVNPLDGRRFGKLRFRYTFLQHGVTNYDISRWVNSKPISLFVVVTPQEQAAIGGPGPYVFSNREVVQTGFPRHDALLRRRNLVSSAERDLIVIMPTWRKALAGQQVAGSNERLKNPDFMTSEFAKNYLELLHSPRLADIARTTGTRIAFMPHPNIRPYLADFELPADVQILDFARDNVQDVLARAALFITDYSSLGFDAAFLDIPVVYFQFDAARFFDGTHVGRRGYFDYQRDGFGPVATDVDSVDEAVGSIASRGFESEDRFLARTAEAFTTRDEDNAERTFQAMRAIDAGTQLPKRLPAEEID
jgi:CDP-glycerol glycerophosphotransferase (TagB/SpsB family)